MPAQDVDLREFFSAIWGDREGVAELTYIDGPIRPYGFTYPVSLDSILTSVRNHDGKTNCYFGVLLRKPGTRIGYYDSKTHRGTEADALASNCVWMDIDFKATPEDAVRSFLKALPLKPSIVVRSGGGVHVYWLLREPAEGDDLRRVKAINRALVRHTGQTGDKQSVDLARVLRVPFTANVKYEPPRPCSISYWSPDTRYNLSQFEEILTTEDEAAPASEEHHDHKPEQAIDIPDDVRKKIEGLLKSLWIEGWRHRMALYVAGVFAHAGFNRASAEAVVKAVSDASHGDTDKRLKDVADTYENFAKEKKVGGAGLLKQMVKEEFPPIISGNAEKIYDEVMKCVRAASPKGKRTNFTLDKILKFDSRPARYRVILQMKGGEQINVDVDNETLLSFRSFMVVAYEQTNQILSCKQAVWEGMIARVTPEIRPAPPEATPAGAFALALGEFIEEKREDADQGILKAFPGYDDREIYFRFSAFKATIKERGIRIEDNDLYSMLRAAGWSSSVRRFGQKTARVWSRPHDVTPEPEKPQMELPMPSIQADGDNEF